MTFLLVGGDERQVYLAKRLAVSNRVLLYGMGEQALSVPGGEILRFPEAGQLREVEVLVLPVSGHSSGRKHLCAVFTD